MKLVIPTLFLSVLVLLPQIVSSDPVNRKIPAMQVSPSESSTEDDRIVFSEGKLLFRPQVSCHNDTFCSVADNYPAAYVDEVLKKNESLKYLSVVDGMPEELALRSKLNLRDSPLCDTYEEVVYPTVAVNKDNEWMFVVNNQNLQQGVRIERCVQEDVDCNLIDSFATGYKTTCKQKYIYRQLIAVSQGGHIVPMYFKFPASCCCHLKFHGDYDLRMNAKAQKETTEKRRVIPVAE